MQKQKAHPSAIKSALWAFYGSILGPFGAIISLYYGHSVLYGRYKNPTKYSDTDKKMAIFGLLVAYTLLAIWIYIIYLVITEDLIGMLFP